MNGKIVNFTAICSAHYIINVYHFQWGLYTYGMFIYRHSSCTSVRTGVGLISIAGNFIGDVW